MAAVVLEAPGHEAQVARRRIEAGGGMFADAPHLLRVGHGIDDMAGAGRDEVDHRQPLGPCLAHDHMRLEEDVAVADGPDGGDHGRIGGIIHRVEQVQPEFLRRRQRTDPDESRDRRPREPGRVST